MMRMLRRLVHREHGREARVRAFEQVTPLVAGLRLEQLGQLPLRVRPRRWIALLAKQLVAEADAMQELGVELRLAGSDRDVTAVGRLVDVVERRTAVEHVRARYV